MSLKPVLWINKDIPDRDRMVELFRNAFTDGVIADIAGDVPHLRVSAYMFRGRGQVLGTLRRCFESKKA